VALAAETMGDLLVFWGFKRSMGVLWTVLYLQRRAMTQEEIAAATGLSLGSVSMTLGELERWGVVHRKLVPRDRRRFYVAETDVRSMVSRVLRERELHKLRGVIQNLEAAGELLREPPHDASGSHKRDSILMAQRMDSLVELAQLGEQLVQKLIQVGQVDLGRLPDLARKRR